MTYLALLHNITLLVSLCLIHGLLLGGFRRRGAGFSLLSGLAFGVAAILAMLTPLRWSAGVIFDGRSIVLALAGLFGGPVAGLVAGTLAGGFRAWLGGAGAPMGVSVVAEATLLGIAWHFLRPRWRAAVDLIPLFGLGVLVHLVMLALMALLPGPLSWRSYEELAGPVILIYPLGFVLIGRVFLELEKHFANRQALAESNARLRTALDLAFDGYWRTSAEGRILEVNEAICRVSGYSRAELLTMAIHEIDAFDDPAQVQARIAQVIREGTLDFQTQHRRRDGQRVDMDVRVTVDPRTGDFLSFFKDITGQLKAEQERARNERLQLALYQIIHTNLGRLIPAGNFYIAVQDPATGLISFPYYVDELDPVPAPRRAGLSLTDLVLRTGETHFLDAEGMRRLAEEGSLQVVGTWARQWLGVPLKEGGRIFGVMAVQSYTSTVSFGPEDVDLFQFVATQIASGLEKKHLTMLHKASEEKFSKVFHSAPLMVTLSRKEDGRLLEVNDLVCRTLGVPREALVGKTSVEAGVFQADERDRLLSVLGRKRSVKNIEFTMLHQDGTPIPCLLSLEVMEIDGEAQVLSMFTDISEAKRSEEERRKLESELDHLQKLESLGRLAGGVAHDMNNILAAILSVAQAMRFQHGGVPDLQDSLALVEQAAGRGRDLVKALVGFTRKDISQAVAIDVNEMVRQEMALLDRTLLKKFRLITSLGEGLPLVTGEPGALGSALMNLCVNAVDAMPEGGTLAVTTRSQGPGFVELLVEDDGEGMTPEVLKRATEPFYTTKPLGKGTGLGLAQVFNTARAHGGYLKLQSEPGAGTRALLGLPCGKPLDEAPAVDGALAGETPLDILLVDDEELIRATVPLMLGFLGHRVTPVPSGAAALSRLEAHGLPDLVILDMNMPEMSGLETLRELRRRYPVLRILVATGFLEREVEAALATDDWAEALTKPYSLMEFQTTLARFRAAGA